MIRKYMSLKYEPSSEPQTFSVGAGAGGFGPLKVKAFINRDDIDFDNVADLPATQVPYWSESTLSS